MKYIIELPEEVKEKFDNATKDEIYGSYYDYNSVIGNAIKNGTPLPKGHGRLIDADVFEKRLMDARSYYIGEKADDFDLRFASGLKSAAERLVDAPTIIEADKENKTMKYKAIVEYEYPIEHKPPVKADIYLHGDKVSTKKIKPIKTGYWKRISPAGIYVCSECGQNLMTAKIECYKFCHGCSAEMGEQK